MFLWTLNNVITATIEMYYCIFLLKFVKNKHLIIFYYDSCTGCLSCIEGSVTLIFVIDGALLSKFTNLVTITSSLLVIIMWLMMFLCGHVELKLNLPAASSFWNVCDLLTHLSVAEIKNSDQICERGEEFIWCVVWYPSFLFLSLRM
jgi:hypothetical protein